MEPNESGIIFKYPLERFTTDVDLPTKSKIVHVAMQYGVPTLWVLHFASELAVVTRRTFIVQNTGVYFQADGMEYVGTCLTDDQDFVVHIFEKTNN